MSTQRLTLWPPSESQPVERCFPLLCQILLSLLVSTMVAISIEIWHLSFTTADLNAELDGELLMNAQASGTLDSGKIPLFEVGIPGLDFPE